MMQRSAYAVLLTFGLIFSGCVTPPPPTQNNAAAPAKSEAASPLASNLTQASSAETALALPATEQAATVDRLVHLRVIESGRVLFSSWPNESWELRDEQNNENATPPVVNATAQLPLVLEPFREMWIDAPPRSTLEVTNFTLGGARADPFNLRRSAFVPIQGEISADAPQLLGDPLKPGLMTLANRIPLNLTPAGEGRFAYRIEMVEGSSFPIPKTDGLFAIFHDHQNGTGEFRLEAPNGTFQSLGCKPIPGTEIPPGWYVIQSQSPESFDVLRYEDRYEPALAHRTVTIQATFLN